jgi:hypothetical protein
MPLHNTLIDQVEIENDILAQPAFVGGRLKFVRSIYARHSKLMEYSLEIKDGKKPIFIKYQAHVADPEQAAVEEFSNLTKLRTVVGPAFSRGLPEPLLVLPSKGILVTSKVPGVPLAAILKKYANRLSAPFLGSAIASKAYAAGLWLKNFQTATQNEPLTFNKDSFLAELERRLSRMEAKGFGADCAQKILERASVRAIDFEGKLIPASARHGDFIVQNILLEGEEVGAVDFEAFAPREPIYDDPGMFLGYLLVLETRPFYQAKCLAAARFAFLEGFGGKHAVDRSLLNMYTLKGAIRTITDGAPLRRSWGRLGMVKNLSKRLQELAAGSL